MIVCLHYTFIDDLFKVHKAKPTLKWRQSFESYLKTMPPYYLGVRMLLLKVELVIKFHIMLIVYCKYSCFLPLQVKHHENCVYTWPI